jgi:hypothetical protein
MPETYWTVPREWTGETCFILAGGPSLRGFDAETIRGRGRVIVINNSYLLAPWADVLYYCDRSWWLAHRTEALATFRGRYRVSLGTSEDGTMRLRNSGVSGLELRPDHLKHGSNGGYQAIGLAFHFGAARIVLLGYDMHVDGERTHWHDGHPNWTPERQQKALAGYLPHFATLVGPLKRAGVEILNATPGSALTRFPMATLEEILKCA